MPKVEVVPKVEEVVPTVVEVVEVVPKVLGGYTEGTWRFCSS